MDIETFRTYCLSKNGVTEEFPFDEVTLVFKVMGKMFALTNLTWDTFKVNLKCDPELAIEYRERYESVQAGYHMNKKHWNTIDFEGDVEDRLLLSMIDHSYSLVVLKLKKSDRALLENL